MGVNFFTCVSCEASDIFGGKFKWYPAGFGCPNLTIHPEYKNEIQYYIQIYVFLLLGFCILLGKARRRRLPTDEIRFSLSRPHPNGVSSIVRGRVEVCLRWISHDSIGGCLWWICLDLVLFHLHSCVSLGWILLIYVSFISGDCCSGAMVL